MFLFQCMYMRCLARLAGGPARPRYRIEKVLHHSKRGTVFTALDTESGRDVIMKRSARARAELDNLLAAESGGCDPRLIQSLERRELVRDGEVEYGRLAVAVLKAFPRRLSLALRKHDPAPDCLWLPRRSDVPPPPPRLIYPYFRAVAELHARTRLAHCDVKPSNFTGAGAGAAGRVLIDFELALRAPATTPTPSSHGTLVFMAPEVLLHGVVSQAADAWSLGVMLHQAMHPGIDHPFMTAAAGAPDGCTLRRELRDAEYRPDMWMCDDYTLAGLCGDLLIRDPRSRMTVAEALAHPAFGR